MEEKSNPFLYAIHFSTDVTEQKKCEEEHVFVYRIFHPYFLHLFFLLMFLFSENVLSWWVQFLTSNQVKSNDED